MTSENRHYRKQLLGRKVALEKERYIDTGQYYAEQRRNDLIEQARSATWNWGDDGVQTANRCLEESVREWDNSGDW